MTKSVPLQVSFSETDNKCFVYEEPEVSKSAVFYTNTDFERIKSEIRVLTHMMKTRTPDNENFCCRGLEKKVVEGIRKCANNRKRAWDAVFEEQYRQSHQNDQDEELIASSYRSISARCLEQAQELAAWDAEAARGGDRFDEIVKDFSQDKSSGEFTVSTAGTDMSEDEEEISALGPSRRSCSRRTKGVFRRLFRGRTPTEAC